MHSGVVQAGITPASGGGREKRLLVLALVISASLGLMYLSGSVFGVPVEVEPATSRTSTDLKNPPKRKATPATKKVSPSTQLQIVPQQHNTKKVAMLRTARPPSKGVQDDPDQLVGVASPLLGVEDVEVVETVEVVQKMEEERVELKTDGAARNAFAVTVKTHSFKQLHHGIYRVFGRRSKIRFAFKTECRPAAKWHGQQGWTEVASYHFGQLLFRWRKDRNLPAFVPFAKGQICFATNEQIERSVHADRCGVVSTAQLRQFLPTLPPIQRGDETIPRSRSAFPPADNYKALYGVALEWQDRHDDTALPPTSMIALYSPRTRLATALKKLAEVSGDVKQPEGNPDQSEVKQKQKGKPGFADLGRKQQLPQDGAANTKPLLRFGLTPPVEAAKLLMKSFVHEKGLGSVLAEDTKQLMADVSDILVFDFLLLNNDRQEKNWFVDYQGRRIIMDNGWMFAGPDYRASVCDVPKQLLLCPPVFRHLTGKSDCAGVEMCRFRRDTAAVIEKMASLGENSWSEEFVGWTEALSSDPLLSLLFGMNKGKVTISKEKVFAEALARYIHRCPGVKEGSKPNAGELLNFLVYGISRRLDYLYGHIRDCIRAYGEDYVLIAA